MTPIWESYMKAINNNDDLDEVINFDNGKFIKQIQEVCIDESVEHDIKLLSSSAPNSFNDTALYDLAQLLQSSDQKTKDAIKKLVRFTSRNSISSILHLIDTQFTLEENTNELTKTNLLDLFLQTKE